MKTLQVLLALLLISLPSFGQSTERPEGIVIPVATLGDVTETRRQILQNTLIESLSSYYRLVPQDKFEEVQEKIFQEMDYEECTEDQCIVMIQEALQVENLFVLQVIGEGSDTQLSLKWVGLDDKKVKTDYCENCGTKELNKKIKGLVSDLKRVIPNGSILISENDEEEQRIQREEKLRKQREEELRIQREEELRKQREEELRDKRLDDIERLNNKRISALNIQIGSGVQSYDYKNKSTHNNESIRWVLLGIYFIKLKYQPFNEKPISIRHEIRLSDNSIVSTGYNEEETQSNEYNLSGISDFNFETSLDYNYYYKSSSFWLGLGIGINNTEYIQNSTKIKHNIKHQTFFISLTTGLDYNFENFGLSMYGSEYGYPIYQKHEYKINDINIESNIVKTGHLNFGISFFY